MIKVKIPIWLVLVLVFVVSASCIRYGFALCLGPPNEPSKYSDNMRGDVPNYGDAWRDSGHSTIEDITDGGIQ